ncbi:putative T7SS-secreted protein [Amycolatopsis samaneae]|uniref:T7SS-secreted protein n=1 Tax=Amycolatopsis samaneae TaxID=664691 RepID=A0ABW5GN12_9PSEU
MNLDRALDAAAPVQTGHYPALGFDPAPGTVARVADVATTLGQVAAEMGQAYEDLTRLGKSDGFWEGDGAQSFQKTVGEVPDYLHKAHQSLSGASGTLTRWAEDLGTMQRQAADLEHQAEAAQAQVTSAQANPNLRLAGQTFTDPAQLQQAQEALGHAQQQLNKAQGDLDALKESAKRLLAQHLDLAGQVAAALRKAKDKAPEEPGLLDRIGEAIGKMVDGIKNLAGKAWDWIKKHADVIAKIGDVLSTVGNVLGLVALATSWIPGVGQVTAAAAVGVSAAAAGTKLLAKAAGADVSWGSIGMDAIGVIPGGRALAGAKNAAIQATKKSVTVGVGRVSKTAEKVLDNIPGIGQKITKKVTSEAAGIATPRVVEPISLSALKNPAKAVQDAAQYAHVNAVQTARLVGVRVADPFSKAGLITGIATQTAIGTGVKEGWHYGVDKVTGGR